jgi:glucoamylase
MPRDITLGNGNVLIAFDKNYILREFYYPHVGAESHTPDAHFKFGVWVDGEFSWLDESWQISMKYLKDTLISDVEIYNPDLQMKISFNDLVDFHQDIFLRKVRVQNLADHSREIRLFFCHDFNISGNNIGDTAMYKPENKTLVHYKGSRYFLINTFMDDMYGITHFATGNSGHSKYEGTWKDAEDGKLSNHPISQGAVDSVCGKYITLAAASEKQFYYWICVSKCWDGVKKLNEVLEKRKPESIFTRTRDYWKIWVNKRELNHELLSDRIYDLYKRSLLVLRTQIDNGGAIIAATDSDIMQFNRDTYSYMWPRDGALVANTMDISGYPMLTANFYNFCRKIIEKNGYFLHKYTPTGDVGSSWHPWVTNSSDRLPIQEDETALITWALWHHFDLYRDIEFIKPLYRPLIKRTADFMVNYRDSNLKLPLPSYDLWEERLGIHIFTVSTVYGGLQAAANFTDAFGEVELSQKYRKAAEEIKDAVKKYFYLSDKKYFTRMVNRDGDTLKPDGVLDASVFAVFEFGMFDVHDAMVKNTMECVEKELWSDTNSGGVLRYKNDYYHNIGEGSPGNPWIITTLWLAYYYIAIAQTPEELQKAEYFITWASDHALESGVLAEQVHPVTNKPLSVSPLTWSHATFATAVQKLIDKKIKLAKCTSCNHPLYQKFKDNQKE